MSNVYVRLILYVIAPLAAMLPFVTYDPDAFTLLIDLDKAGLALGVAVGAVAGVFKKWGTK